MTGTTRPAIGIVDADAESAAALEEWLRAAGYEPRAFAPGSEVAAVVVRWPGTPPGRAGDQSPPVVLLAPAHAVLPPPVLAAVDEVVVAPDHQDIRSLLQWSKQLHAALRQITAPPALSCAVPLAGGQVLGAAANASVIAVGVSTGGPIALRELFRALRGAVLPPLVLVQHMPPAFLPPLAERLMREGERPVQIAAAGETLRPGTAYLAPGDRHLGIEAAGGHLRALHDHGPPRRGHRPAVEVLFESCLRLPTPGIAVLLTGMGQDGAQAMLALRGAGWVTLGQDEATCAIYGMPKAARQLGAVVHELPLQDIGPWLVRATRSRRGTVGV